MKILYRLASLSMVWLTLSLFLTGCGGGGGGASSGGVFTPPAQNGGSTPPAITPPSSPSPNIATVIQGSIGFPTDTNNSISRLNLSRIHFALAKVDLTQKQRNPLSSVTVQLWATRDDGDGLGQKRLLLLDDTITDSLGEYQLQILESKFDELSDKSNGSVNSVESLYQSNTYRLEIVMTRPAINRVPPIDKKIYFRPSHNDRPIGGSNKKPDLTVNALIDFNNDSNLSLEVANTQELEEWESKLETLAAENPSDWNPRDWKPEQLAERLVLKENVDIDGNGIPDETAPLVLFEKPIIENNIPKIENRQIVRVFELDADNDGKFAESDDLVSASIFGGDANSEAKVAGFVDLESDGNFNDPESLKRLDETPPFIEFVTPVMDDTVIDNLDIKVRFCDCEGFDENGQVTNVGLGYDISTLKVWFNKRVEFLNPSRFSLLPRSDIAQPYFSKISDGGTSGTASFTLQNVNFAFGLDEFEHSILASIQDFAGNELTTSVNFVINGPPQIQAANEYTVSEGETTFTTSISIRDVDPLDISIRMISGAPVPPWIYLTSSATTIQGSTLPELAPIEGIINVNLNVIPGNDFALEGNQVLLLEAKDPKTVISKPITIRPRKSNTPSDFIGICWVNDRTFLPHPFSVEPQNVCTVIGSSQEQNFCRTNSTIPLSIPENELSKFIMCGTEKDSEDQVFFTYQSIVPETGTTSFDTPQFNEEFYFKSPETVEHYIDPNSGSILATTARTKSSISVFEWQPLGNAFPNQNLLTFRATDGKGTDTCIDPNCTTSEDMSIILSVTTIQDPPEIVSVSTQGLRTGEFPSTNIYARPNIITIENDSDFFEEFREGESSKILFKAQQGQPIQIEFTATDDETPTGAIDPTMELVLTPAWLSATNISPRDNYRLRLEGTPLKEDALLVQEIKVQTNDPTNLTSPTTYTFRIEILDQNDVPFFNPSSSEANASIPLSTDSISSQKLVTISIAATEDVTVEFFIHAYDIDPTQSPYNNPQSFNFLYENVSFDSLATSPDPIVPLTYTTGTIYRSARIRWEPKSEDTNESQPAGVAATKENKLITIVTANCPSEIELIENCLQQTNFVDFRINVLSVDEPPKFKALLKANVQLFESDGSLHKTTTVELNEGLQTEIKQMVKDEENQLINDIRIKAADPSLSSFVANQFVFTNNISSQESFIALTGLPTVIDYVNNAESVTGNPLCSVPLWVQPNVESVCIPQVVTMGLEVVNSIAATGAETSETKILKFQVIDVADPPIFVDPKTHDPSTRESNNLVNNPISSVQTPVATEDQPFSLDIAVFNKVDKNPEFWDGFYFEIIKFPDPIGNISIRSDLNNTTATTATITWNPKQEHVIGTGSKQHEIIVRACIRDRQSNDPSEVIPNSCRDQTYRINVQPTNDAPRVFFGDQKRDLTSDPITQTNPFIVLEDSNFERLIRVEDEDLQSVNLQVALSLAAFNNEVNARTPGSILASPSETINPIDLTPIVANPGDNFLEQIVSWSSIDWDDISLTSTIPQVSSTYILTLIANTPDDSTATGQTLTEVYLEVRSVNDIPKFTTNIIPTVLEQSDGQQDDTSEVIDFLTIIDNEEGDELKITLVDKGSAANFLTDVSETQIDERTRVLYLSNSPGQNGVGEHQLQVKVEEKLNPESFNIAELTLIIRDSNDAPIWEVNPLFSGVFPMQEGQSKEETLFIVDSDLFSNPDAEKITFTVKGSFMQSFATSDLLFSNNQNFATTSDMAFLGVTQAPIVNSDRQPYSFNFSPLRVTQAEPFAVTTYYLQFTATDQFLNTDDCEDIDGDGFPDVPCSKSAIETIAFEITPKDDTPLITKVNSVDLPNKDIAGICFNVANNCVDQLDYVSLADMDPLTFSITALDQETEALTFNFSALGTDLTTNSQVSNLTLSDSAISLTQTNPNTPDSIVLTFSPTNGNVGLEQFTLKVQDTSDSSGSSRNSTRISTRTFSMLIQNTADAPFFKSITQNSADLTNSVTPIIFYEDSINTILINIDDLDLHIPRAFTATERTILSSTYNLNTTSIALLENQLFPQEFFSYTLQNITTYPGLQLLDNSNDQLLFQYSSPANISVTSTTDVIRLSWVPSDEFTYPEIPSNGGNIPLELLVKSFSSNSVVSTRPTSLSTNLQVRVYPVNDQPIILNQELEALATQDNPFSFTVNGQDEEENALTYFFNGSVPGDMVFQGNQIVWNPTNSDTTTNIYDLQIYAADSGVISKVQTTGLINTEPQTSEIYNLKLFLNNVDDPATRDGTINPLTQTQEDQLYITNIRYTDPDFNDILEFSFHLSPGPEMTIEDDDQDGTATIRWENPSLPGTFDVIVRVDSVNQGILRSSVYYPYQITVDPVNDAPVFISAPLQNMVENQLYIYNIDVTDEDDLSVNLELIKNDIPESGLECDDPSDFVQIFASDKKLQGTTDLAGLELLEASYPGGVVTSYNICIQATDGSTFATQAFPLKIQVDNNPPTIDSLMTSSDDYPSSVPSIQTTNTLLNDRDRLIYSAPSTRKVTLYQGYLNEVSLAFSDEESDTPMTFEEVEGPGAILSVINATGRSSTLLLSYTPNSADVISPPTFKIRATDARSRQTEFSFETLIVDTPDLPVCTFNKSIQLINEDLSQVINLGCSDEDLTSTLSYSIVTNSAITTPVALTFDSNINGNPNLQLQINHQGEVTFIAKESVNSFLPVTFSVCGTSRNITNFETDCINVSFNYDVLDRNDEPIFKPSIPASSKRTASEGLFANGKGYRGGVHPGLTFRFVHSGDPCPPETSEEICIYDEETLYDEGTSDSDLNGQGKVALSIKTPEVKPTGLQLSNYSASCYPHTTDGTVCLQGTEPSFSCLNTGPCGAVSSKLTYVQTLTWNDISFDQPSTLNLEIEAKERVDVSKFSIFNFSLQITNTNREPYINNRNPLLPEQIVEAETFNFNLANITSEDDSDPVSYSIVKGVTGMTINTSTGLITWTPNVSHIGEHLITYRVVDIPSSGTPLRYTTDQFITVLKKNNPPVINNQLRLITDSSVVRETIATENALFEARILAQDEEGDAFSFFPSLSTLNGSPLPNDFNLTSFGTISWTPKNSDVGPIDLTVVVKDTASGGQSSQTFNLTVKNVNDTPVITNKVNTTLNINEQETFTYSFITLDQDAGDVLNYSVDASQSLSATITNTGVLTLIPNADAAGSYLVTVSVIDNYGGSDSNTFSLNVAEQNNPPELEPVAEPLYVNRASVYTAQLYANDPENDAITFSFISKPNNVEIDQNSGLLTITPLADKTQEFQVRVRDSQGQFSIPRTVKLQFTDNQPPIITSTPNQVERVLTPYNYEVLSDAQNYATRLVRGPVNMSVPQNTNLINWTPQYNQETGEDDSGVHIVEVRVQADVEGESLESDPQRYLLTINKENEIPVLEYVQDLNGDPITIHDALQGIQFTQTVLRLTDEDETDLQRLDFYFANTNKSKSTSANSNSQSIAQLTEAAVRIEDGKAIKEIMLSWSPDNGAAYAETKGQNNRFTIMASDGINEATPISIDFRVTDVNDPPVLNDQENQGGTEIGYVDQVYSRDFFARDVDNQEIYFCLDTENFFDPAETNNQGKYPSFKPVDKFGEFNVLNDRGILSFTGDGETIVNGNFPDNHICTLGLEVIDDPNPELGRLSKATLVWTPDDTWIDRSPYIDLTFTLWDGVAETQSSPFNLKLAPIVNNLVPPIQYVGEEVAISGGGILETANQLNVLFIRSDGSISAVTQAYDLGIRGKGKFTVPEDAASGFVSVGFTSFSSPAPFTVLNGKTTTLIGSTNEDQDLLSIPAGIASTYVDTDIALLFVSNRDYHTIHAYKYQNQVTSLLGIISGQQGSSGDIDGNNTVSRLSGPTGLSIAYYQDKHYVLVADTQNNKIKAVDVSDLIDNKLYDDTWTTTTYTIADSNHLNRPYKAIQHSNPTSGNHFYIANTFGNTIELLYTGNKTFDSLTPRESIEKNGSYITVDNKVLPNIGDIDVRGSSNTYAVAGSGHARSDVLGNVFHPVDLEIVRSGDDYRLMVSNYSNYKYSLNSSFRIYKGEEADRNNTDNNNIADPFVIQDFNIDAMSLAKYGPQTLYDGDVLLVTSSNHNSLVTTEGMTQLEVTTRSDQTDLSKYYITGPDTYFTEPKTLTNKLNEDIKITYESSLERLPSRQKTFYQTHELKLSTSVVDSGYISTTNTISKATSFIKFDTKEVAITPISDQGVYSIATALITTLPDIIGDNDTGEPTYYDTNRDGIADLWLPIPLLGEVYIFPGEDPNIDGTPPLSFDMVNYWKINSNSISDECASIDCLKGVNKVAFGRIMSQLTNEPTTTSKSIIVGDDMVIVVPFNKKYIIVDGYSWTYDVNDFTGDGKVSSLPDYNFHIDRAQAVAGQNQCIQDSDGNPGACAEGNKGRATAVDFKAPGGGVLDVPYTVFNLSDDNNPENVCIGYFTQHYLEQTCKYGSVDATTCESSNDASATLTDIELTLELDATTSPTWDEARPFLDDMEQMVFTYQPTPGENNKLVALKIIKPGPEIVSVDLTVPSIVTPQCGEPFIRTGVELEHLETRQDPAQGRQEYPEAPPETRKKDSIFYIDSTNKFQFIDFDDDNSSSLYGKPSPNQFADTLSTIKTPDNKTVSSASDFLLYDVTGDGVVDLISIHPSDQKLIITKGTGNRLLLLEPALKENVQELRTLPGPAKISIIKSKPDDPLRSEAHIVDIVVTNSGASSLSVFEHFNSDEESPGKWFKPGLSFEVGGTGNIYGDSVIATDEIFTGDVVAIDGSVETTEGLAIWDRYHYGNHAPGKYPHIGLAATAVSTKGVLGIRSTPNDGSSLTALPIDPDLIFRSTYSYGVTSDPAILEHVDLNRDGIKDIVVIDTKNKILTNILSNSSNTLTFDQQAIFYPIEKTGGIAFGDLDQRRDKDNIETTDIVLSNFNKNSIQIYFNGGVPISNENTVSFAFDNPGFPSKNISVGRGPRGLTVADLNNDGMLDIAVANNISDNVSVIYAKTVDPLTFDKPIFYSVDDSPISVIAMPTRTHGTAPNAVLDLVTVNGRGESATVLRNKRNGGDTIKGFYKPQTVKIAEYSPSHHRTIDSTSGLIIDPLLERPFFVESGDFGNLTSYTSSILLTNATVSAKISGSSSYAMQFQTETLRYDNLVVGYRSMVYNIKNIGDKSHSAHRSSISSFTINSDASLSLDSMISFDAESAVKSMVASEGRLFFVVSTISDRTHTLETDINDSLHTSAAMYSVLTNAELDSDPPDFVSTVPYLTNFDILEEEFGAGIEAMSYAANGNSDDSVFAIHSGRNRGILKLNDLESNSYNAEYVVNVRRQTPTQSSDPSTVLSQNIQLLSPGGMTVDFNNLTLLSVDRGNEFIRITDLQDSVTRTMQLRDDQNPSLSNVVDITNQSNTFNYFAIGSDRKLYLINPSNEPISVTTQNFDNASPFNSPPHSSMNWFEIKSHENYLFIGAKNDMDQPTDGYIYRVNLDATPLAVEPFNFPGGINGFDIDSSGTILYYSEPKTFQMKKVDLSISPLSPTTLAGSYGIGGHFDGPATIALINKPRDVILNSSDDLLYFIDGSSIRSINLDNSITGEYEVATISGDPFRTGILNSDGQRALFIKPAYLYYELRGGKDILYIADELAHNIRRVEVKP